MSDSDTKICTRCHEEKALTEFYKCKKARDGLKPWCKACHKEAGIAYRMKNRQRIRENSSKYYYENIEKARARNRKYRAVNKEKNRAKVRAYYYRNKEKWKAEAKAKREAKEKFCFVCGIEKGIEKFYRDRTKADGICYRCKQCAEKQKAEKRERDREEKKRLIKEKILSDLRGGRDE